MIRLATSRDAPVCAGIMRDWIEETEWFNAASSKAEDTPFILSKIDKQQVWVADASGEQAGFVALEDDFLSCLYIARSYRRQGIGRHLLDHAKTQAKTFTLWTFVANSAAQAFYLREGLAETNRTQGDNDEGLPDIEFTWNGAAP